MKRYIILATFLAGLPVLAQHKTTPKTKIISSRINIREPKPRILDAAIKEYTIYFKGFSLVIQDEATDELGNHMLVGRIKALEKDEKKRDPLINKAINFSVGFYDYRDFMISTDQNYKILKVRPTYRPQTISYNTKLKNFIIGGNDYGYGDSNGKWQPMITVVDLEQYGTAYAIKNDYSCYLKDLIIEEDKIHVLAASEEIKYNEKLEMITVDLNKFHADKEAYLPEILDPISHIIFVNQDNGRIDISGISKVGSDYYFSTSNLDQTNIKYKTYIFKFDGRTLEDQTKFKYFNDHIYSNPDLVKLSGFYTDPSNGPVFLTQRIGFNEMNLTKTNTNYDIKKNIKIKLFDYIEWAEVVAFTNGNIVVLSQNENKIWEYSVYNSDLILTKKINSGFSGNYYPGKLKIANEHIVECLFYDTRKIKNDAVVQYATVN
ncbi:hypothetical protein OF897_16915 [Chryseobacterium formosus]|uniref:Uncharacterized protein n=1 Tax=Chryseobacterium formosus TaxID=1537363 RepID=A0ABT3XVC6_9FLAO|nr:hypothetical protein [Chryseobacterium formosus]MCX8525597.1 hypothetical protein [Chryseobacterium formosus]